MNTKKHNHFRPYPKSKDSGIPWLGEIPNGWDVFRNGRLFAQRNQTGFGELPILEVSLKTGVRVRDMDNMKRKQVMADREKYKRAKRGDIAYNMMRMWQGAVGVAPVDGLVSPAYVVARPFPDVSTRFFTYLFRTASYMKEVDAYSRGIVKDRNRLYWQDFKAMPSIVPPPGEQTQIARFLDWKTSQINRFIYNKRRLIELLREQKQNIINQAVTRGLDPKVKLKPSGVDWLGDVPEHWEVRRIKFIFRERDERKRDVAFELLSFSRAKGLVPHAQINSRPPSAEDLSKYKVCRPGHLLMNRMQAWSGMFTDVTIEGVVSPDYSVFEPIPKKSVFVAYYGHLFRTKSHVYEFANASKGVGDGFNRLYTPMFGAIFTLLPPIDEQKRIVEHINSESIIFDATIQRAEREIELILEYRNRLISDTVTGKIDVQGISVPEPDAADLTPLDAEVDEEMDEDEPIDEGDTDDTD